MNPLLPGSTITKLCELLERRICNTRVCDHLGRVCEAPSCSNHVCSLHEFYCSKCEQHYCEDCWTAHLNECGGPSPDEYDEALEHTLAGAAQRIEANDPRGLPSDAKLHDPEHGIQGEAGDATCGRAGVVV